MEDNWSSPVDIIVKQEPVDYILPDDDPAGIPNEEEEEKYKPDEGRRRSSRRSCQINKLTVEESIAESESEPESEGLARKKRRSPRNPKRAKKESVTASTPPTEEQESSGEEADTKTQKSSNKKKGRKTPSTEERFQTARREAKLASMTEEELKEYRAKVANDATARREAKLASMTDDELKEYREKVANEATARRKTKLATMTEEELKEHRAKVANDATARREAKLASMTEEELKEYREKVANEATARRKTKLATMTEEELKEHRAKVAKDANERRKAKMAAMTEEELKELRSQKSKKMAAKYAAKAKTLTKEKREEQLRLRRERRGAHQRKLNEQENILKQKEELAEEDQKLLEEIEQEKYQIRMKRYLAQHACDAKLTKEDKAMLRREKLLKKKARRAEETPEEREARTERQRARYLMRRAGMTLEELEDLRKKGRDYQRAYKQKKRKQVPYSQWSEEKKEKFRLSLKQRRDRATPEETEKRLARYRLNQKRQTELKRLMTNSGVSREEAKDLLKQTNPELFPPPAPRGGPRGPRKRMTDTPAPYIPCPDGRGNRKGNSGNHMDIPEEELQEYLADKEKWKQNFDKKWKNQQRASSSRNDISDSCDSSEYQGGNYFPENDSTSSQSVAGQSTSTVTSETFHSAIVDRKLNIQANVPSTSSLEPLLAAAKMPLQDKKPKHEIENDTLDNNSLCADDDICMPEYSPPSSPLPGVEFGHETNKPAVEQNFVDAPILATTKIVGEVGNIKVTEANKVETTTNNVEDQPVPTSKSSKKTKTPTEYCCDMCGKIYRSKLYYIAHMSEAHGETTSKVFSCPDKECSMTFVSSLACRMHFRYHTSVWESNVSKTSKKRKQRGAGPYACSICNEEFDTIFDLNSHAKQVHSVDYRALSKASQICQHCGKTFKQKSTLDDHIRRIHLGMDNSCDLCSRRFQSAAKLWKHKVDHHGLKGLHPSAVGNIKVQLCIFCGEYIFRGMKTHIEQQHPEHLDEYTNMEEQKNLSSKKDCKTRDTYGNSKDEYFCPVCQKTISTKSKKRHIYSMHPESVADTRQTCDICGKQVWTAKNLATHILHWHFRNIELDVDAKVKSDSETEPPTCQFCSNEQEDRNMYKLHIIDQHPEELIGFVKTKIAKGTLLTKQDVKKLRRIRYKQKNPGPRPDKRRNRKSIGKQKQTEIADNPERKYSTRSSRKSKKLRKSCDRQSALSSMPEEDKKILERFPEINWRTPVVNIKALTADEIRALLAPKIKQEVP